MIGIVSALQTATVTLFLAATAQHSEAVPLQPNLVGLPVASMQGFDCDYRVMYPADYKGDNTVSGECWNTQLIITADGSQHWVPVAGSKHPETIPPLLPRITKTALLLTG